MKFPVRKIVGHAIVIAILIIFILVVSRPPAEPTLNPVTDAQNGDQTKVDQTKVDQTKGDAKTPAKKKELSKFDAKDLDMENGRYRLHFDGRYGSVHITDKQTGQTWDSVPELDRTIPPNNQRFIRSPVLVRYTEGKGNTQTYPFKENGKLSPRLIDNGKAIRADIHLPDIGISFAVEYRLTEDGLELKVPYDSIKEGAEKKLVSIEVVPFFEAAYEKDKGAMVIPDGSGALIGYKPKHPQYFEPYSEFVYGGDHAYQKDVYEKVTENPREMLSFGPRERAALPVYGLYKNGKAFLAILEDGEENAKINATPSGLRNIKMYRASPEFIYRNDDIVYLGDSGEIPLTLSDMVPGDRKVRFLLLQGKQADYVGMANAYRDYLIKEKALKPIAGKEISYQLRLLGGVLRGEILGRTFISMTTFEQAKAMIDQLTAKGVRSIQITYDGWSDGGKYGNQPAHLPADSHLGGNGGLRELSEYAKSKGVELYVKTNYVKPYSKSDSLKASADAIRGLNKEVLKVYRSFVATRQATNELYYFLKANRVFDRYVSKESPKLADLGIQGAVLGYMGNTLYSDPGSKHPMFRKETMEAWVRSMDTVRKDLGKAAVEYGFGYSLGHVDRIDDIPLDSSHYPFEDGPIPFYQIAIHGLIPYTAQPSNLRDDPRTEFLRALEYGAAPSFELTHEDPVELKRTMEDRLFSSSFAQWLDVSVEEYNKMAAVLNQVNDQPIVGHEKLQPNVYRTTYGNGVQVTVNYGEAEAKVEGQVIAPYGYAVKGGTE